MGSYSLEEEKEDSLNICFREKVESIACLLQCYKATELDNRKTKTECRREFYIRHGTDVDSKRFPVQIRYEPVPLAANFIVLNILLKCLNLKL
jgi:hypothetical protein